MVFVSLQYRPLLQGTPNSAWYRLPLWVRELVAGQPAKHFSRKLLEHKVFLPLLRYGFEIPLSVTSRAYRASVASSTGARRSFTDVLVNYTQITGDITPEPVFLEKRLPSAHVANRFAVTTVLTTTCEEPKAHLD